MKKYLYITICFFFLFAGNAMSQCSDTPSCESLGYTKKVSDCSGDMIKCPFDLAKVFCSDSVGGGDGGVTPPVDCEGSWILPVEVHVKFVAGNFSEVWTPYAPTFSAYNHRLLGQEAIDTSLDVYGTDTNSQRKAGAGVNISPNAGYKAAFDFNLQMNKNRSCVGATPNSVNITMMLGPFGDNYLFYENGKLIRCYVQNLAANTSLPGYDAFNIVEYQSGSFGAEAANKPASWEKIKKYVLYLTYECGVK